MTDTPRSRRRLDPETLAAYVDGRLPPEERGWVEAELAQDPASYEWLVHTMRAEQHVHAMVPDLVPVPDEPLDPRVMPQPHDVVRFPQRRAVVVGRAILALAAALLLIVGLRPWWWQPLTAPSTDPQLDRLVAAVEDDRYVQGRLTGGFKYAPVQPVSRAPADLSSQNLSLLAAAGELQKSAKSNPSAKNLHAWGVAQLLLGDVDAAIDTLNTAARLEPSTPSYLSDLGVAYLARFTATGSADDLPAAFERVEQALLIAPDNVESLFNRVQILSAMGLQIEARAALENYLRRDPSSGWASEAVQQVDRLKPRSALDPDLGAAIRAVQADARPDGSDLQAVREFVEEDLLGRRVATAATDSKRTQLERVAVAGVRLAALQGDSLLSEAIADWRDATPERSETTSRAFDCYAHARTLQRAGRTKEMGERAVQCSKLFRELSSPYVRWTTLMEARAAQTAGDLVKARQLAQVVFAGEGADRYPITSAWARLQLAAVAFLQSQYSGADQLLAQAIDALVRAGELEHAAAACELRAAALFEGGDRASAWGEYMRALRFLPERRQSNRWYATRNGVSLALLNNSWPRTATEVLSGNLDNATANGFAIGIAESNRNLARAQEMLGQFDVALTHLEASERAWVAIGDQASRDRSHAELLWAQARRLTDSAPDEALQRARASQAIFGRLGIEPRLAPMKLFEARAALKAFGPARAAVAADEGIDLLTRQETLLSSPRQRDAFRLSNADIYRHAASTLVEASDAEGSLLRFEQLRRLHQALPRLVDLDSAKSVLGANTVAIVFAFHKQQLYRWVVDRDGITVRTLVADHAKVATLAAGFKAALQLGADIRSEFNRELSSLLLDSLSASAQRAIRWVVVPDGPLFSVPFSMLLEGDRGVVAERREVVVASSLLAYVARHKDAGPVAAHGNRAAVFAAPKTDVKGIRPLPGALEEGTRVAALYAAAPLTGRDATRSAFLAALRQSPIVHFSGHALLNPREPGRSLLLFAPTAADHNGALFQADIEQTHARARIVVLAGCSTAESADAQGEGVSSIARSFVKSGVPWVIATLWPIADEAAADVFVQLHELLLRDVPPAKAVRLIQDQGARNGQWGSVRSSLVVVGA